MTDRWNGVGEKPETRRENEAKGRGWMALHEDSRRGEEDHQPQNKQMQTYKNYPQVKVHVTKLRFCNVFLPLWRDNKLLFCKAPYFNSRHLLCQDRKNISALYLHYLFFRVQI